jgi:uracil-DNA glycosylase
MPRVFVVQEPLQIRDGQVQTRFSLAPLKQYGELVNIFSWTALRDVGMTPAPEEIDNLLWMAKQALASMRVDDYLVPMGNPALIAIAVLVACEMTDGRVRILDWMKLERAYRCFNIDLEAIPN